MFQTSRGLYGQNTAPKLVKLHEDIDSTKKNPSCSDSHSIFKSITTAVSVVIP